MPRRLDALFPAIANFQALTAAAQTIARYEHYRDRYAHVLRCDVFRFFPSIDYDILKHDLRRPIACPRTLDLMDRIIDGSNPQEPSICTFPATTCSRRSNANVLVLFCPCC